MLTWGVWLGACAPDLKVPEYTRTEPLSVEPSIVNGVTSRVIRITAHPDETVRLFAQRLSAGQISNIRRDNAASKVLALEIPLTVDDGADAGTPSGEQPENAPTNGSVNRTWTPTRLLAAGSEYTLVTERRTLSFSTVDDEVVVERAWPKEQHVSNALFCLSDAATPLLANPTQLLETDVVQFGDSEEERALANHLQAWLPLAHTPACWFFEPGRGDLWPEHAPSLIFQPTTFVAPVDPAPEAPSCGPGEQALEWGCVLVEDDRVLVRGGAEPSLWVSDASQGAWFALEAQGIGVVKGLLPDRAYDLDLVVHFPRSAPIRQTLSVRTGAPKERIVINEVLADPLGDEATQEWVELYNEGLLKVNIEGWRLEDDGGSVVLPSAWIAPGGYALLVNETYDAKAVQDPVPEPNVSLVRLPRLAKSGISNQGETLRLRDKSDMVVSTFPGTPKPAPGVSVARGAPWQADGDPATFGLHAAPGASPGAANVRTAELLSK